MIHHPMGDLKKVAIESDDITTHSFMTTLFKERSHWRVYRWDLGISEGGSSGSPLFDSDNRIVGALSGGQSECSTTGPDSFYELLKPWSQPKEDGLYLAQWLDPLNSDAVVLDGKEANGTPCVRLSISVRQMISCPKQRVREAMLPAITTKAICVTRRSSR